MAVRKDEVNLQVTIGAQQAGNTLRDLKKEARDMRRLLERIPVGTKEFEDARAKLKAVTDQIAAAEGRMKQVVQQTTFWQRALAGAVGVFGGLSLDNIFSSLLAFGQKLFDVGTSLDALNNKTRTVFGEAEGVVRGFAETNARSLGLAQQEYVNLATNAGDLLKPMGFAEDAVANLSVALTDQAGVLSEWSGGKVSTQEASAILTKALLGERDALNSLGIDIKDSLVQDELKARGLQGLTGESKRQAEALVTLDLITRQSASANEAFANNTDSLVRSKAQLRAKLAEVSQTAASALVPVFSALLKIGLLLIDWAVRFAQTLAAIPGFIRENQVQIGALVVALVSLNAQGIVAAATALRLAAAQRATAIATTAQAAAQRALNFVLAANPIGLVITAVATLGAVLVTAYQRSETFRRVVTGVFAAVTDSVRAAIGFFTDLGSGLANLFTGNFDQAVSAFSNAFKRLNPAEVGRSLKESFVRGYESVPTPPAEIKADEVSAKKEGANVGAAFTTGFESQFEALKKSGQRGGEAIAKAAKDALDLRLKEIEAAYLKEELIAEVQRQKGQLNESNFGREILILKKQQYQQQIEAFKKFNQEETKEAIEAQKKLLEVQAQLTPKGIAPVASLGTKQPGQVTSQTAAGLAGADVSAADDVNELRKKFADILTLEQANEAARLDIQRNALAARLEFLRNAGLQDTQVFQETLDAKLKADQEYHEQIVENEQRSADLKKKVQEASYQISADFVSLAIDLLGQDEKARKKNGAAIKVFQTAQVVVQGIAEVQKIWAGAAELGPIAGPIVGALQSAVAVGRTVLAINKIARTKFKRGVLLKFAMGQLMKFGFFGGKSHAAGGTKGYFEDGTAIEVEKDEAFAIVNKRNAPLLRALSAINSAGGNGVPFFEKGGIPRFAIGGLPTVNTTPPGIASPNAAAQPLLSNMTDFIGAVEDFRQIVRTFPREVKSRVVYTELRDTAAEVATVEADASI